MAKAKTIQAEPVKEGYTAEEWPIAKVKPYDNNPRKNDTAVEAVANSIRQFGFRQPIVVDDRGVVVVGHTRLKAAAKLGMETVPVHVAKGLTAKQARAYRIADNKTNELAEWDDDALRAELAELEGIDFAGLGFDAVELERLIGFGSIEEASAPELASGDREPFQQMTFTLHDDQAEQVKEAVKAAIAAGPFVGPNENSNGNALARIAEAYLGSR